MRFAFSPGSVNYCPRTGRKLPSHWRVNQTVLQQVRHIVAQIEAVGSDTDTHAVASREILFMQLLVLLRKSSLAEEATNNDARLNQLLAWLEDHFAQEICWEEVAAQFSLSLRTLHRQLKQQTGLTPQRYLNRVRLMKARHLLRHSDESVTDIAYRCGFGDSNHFSTLFRREFDWSPRDIRRARRHSSVTREESTYCRLKTRIMRRYPRLECEPWPV